MSDRDGIRKRSVVIAGHATSVSVEPEFWEALREIAAARAVSVNQLIAEIDGGRTGNLSSAIRLFVLAELRARAAESRGTD
ncbi:ribbon-helix-helix domain-containing protein [Shumkonia mesophila]|uniref:ribbon-helix-helix domain-containing protein n=1 Tax=Shumkonia mesophila TaxID=2838854 RepID=UPI002934C5C5|nr:ribbon-helix-helix domain-containing protein [Shumkonia mesophila]